MAKLDDEAMLEAARAGDRGALERLLTTHQHRVFRFGIKMCGEEEDAKDVVQDTLIAAARNIRDFRGASSVVTWLYSIARSFCVKKRRTSKFAPERVDSMSAVHGQAEAVADPARDPEDVAAGLQVRSALQRAISALEPMYREVLVLRDVEGLSAAEVAEVLGVSVDAVKSRLHRARVQVRTQIAPLLGTPEPLPDEGDPKTCPEIVELFSKHLEGDITGPVCTEMEVHVRGCPRCSARCDSLRATLSLCTQSGDRLPPRVEHSVRDALRKFLDERA